MYFSLISSKVHSAPARFIGTPIKGYPMYERRATFHVTMNIGFYLASELAAKHPVNVDHVDDDGILPHTY